MLAVRWKLAPGFTSNNLLKSQLKKGPSDRPLLLLFWNCRFRTIRLSPAAGVNRALLLGDFRKACFVILGVFFNRSLDFAEQAAMKFFLGDPIAQEEHRVCFAPVLAILPNLHRIATHLLGYVNQSWIVHVVAIAEKDLVVDRKQLHLKIVKRPRRN